MPFCLRNWLNSSDVNCGKISETTTQGNRGLENIFLRVVIVVDAVLDLIGNTLGHLNQYRLPRETCVHL